MINATVTDGAGNSAATCSGRRSPYAHTHLGLDEAAHHLGRAGEALAAARTGREAVEAQEERGHLAWAERVLGDALSAGAPREARPHHRRAAEINGALGMRPELELASPAPASRGSGAADPGEDDPPRRS